ncbi:CDP-glucose 4,6-dehydratase [Arenimonas aestuarii]
MEVLDLTSAFGGAYVGRRVLVTGHTGFKGSWLCLWLQSMGADVAGYALDPDTTPSHWQALGLHISRDIRADLRDPRAVSAALDEFQPELVVHLAAQPLVRRSYRDPTGTFETNVVGLVNLFEAVRACPSVRAVVNATTDKVYEPPSRPEGYREADPLGGHDPYSASKACAEIVSASYRRSFFRTGDERVDPVRLATARAGNVIGGGDWAEDRLVPDLVRATMAGQTLHLRNPAATRPWQHVLEPLSGYLELGRRLLAGEDVDRAWNFGPASADCLTVGEVVAALARHWPGIEVATTPGPHPHEAGQLVLDSSAARGQLGWKPVWDAAAALARTATWYRAFLADGRLHSTRDLDQYVADARSAGLPWAG